MQNLIDSVIKELEQKNYFEAIKYCNQLIAQYPRNYVFYEIRGNCYLETGSYVTAIQNYTDAIEYFVLAEGKSNSEVASLYNRRGYARLKLNLYNEALSDFQRAIEHKPDFAEAYNNSGNAYRKLDRYDEALAQCDKAIEYKPDFAEAYNNRGNIYYLFSKDVEAIYDYTRAIELKQNYAGAYYNRGTAYYYLQNKLIEAKNDWEKVIKLNPSYEKELGEKIAKIDNALDLMRQQGEIPVSNEPLSLVGEEKFEEMIEETHEEPVEEIPEEHIEAKHEEPLLEIYDKSVPEEPETVKPEEPETVKPEEPEIVKPEEPEIIKSEEPVLEKFEEPSIEKIEEPKTEEPESEVTGTEEPVKEETIPEIPQSGDIEIPEIDFKTMFKENEQESGQVTEQEDDLKPLSEIFELIYQPKISTENIIPEEVRQLHKEIEEEAPALEIPEEKKEEIPEVPAVIEEELKTADTEIPKEPRQKEKASDYLKSDKILYATEDSERSAFKSPFFIIPLIFIILLILTVSIYFIYNKFYVKKLQTAKQETTAVAKDTSRSSGNIDSTQIKDTIAVDKKSVAETKTESKEDSKKKEVKEEKTDNTAPEVTMIKNFVVIKDKDGIYLQVASLKEKNSADTKAASINKKGIVAKVVEADLGAKGKYYRVRVGPFKNIDEAKTAANKID